MTTTATRLITLIMLLQRHPNQKAGELASELGISIRTLHRYFAMLDEMGIPIFSQRGPYGGFSLVRGYKLPPLVFTPEEAVALTLGTGLVKDMWGELYREAAGGALAKLENVLPEDQRREAAWAQRTLVSAGLHRADLDAVSPILEKLRRAARDHHRVRMCYQSLGQPDPTVRDLDPYALVHRSGWWYLIGYCHIREAIRTFRVDRISQLEILEQGFDVPQEFDIHAYLAQQGSPQPALTVRMRFSPQMASVARGNTLSWETVEEQSDGAIIVTFLSSDLIWATSWAMAFGPGVTVLEPEEVRQSVREWARATLEKYLSLKGD
ncbi:MAG: YafY family protein [Chloroflexota bacterium]